jgi:hypothetical protein
VGSNPSRRVSESSSFANIVLSQPKLKKRVKAFSSAKIRLEKDRDERRQKKEEEVAMRKAEQPALFTF